MATALAASTFRPTWSCRSRSKHSMFVREQPCPHPLEQLTATTVVAPERKRATWNYESINTPVVVPVQISDAVVEIIAVRAEQKQISRKKCLKKLFAANSLSQKYDAIKSAILKKTTRHEKILSENTPHYSTKHLPAVVTFRRRPQKRATLHRQNTNNSPAKHAKSHPASPRRLLKSANVSF